MVYWGLNEADWPHRSWGTGHLNDTTGDCEGPMDSIYENLYHRVCISFLFRFHISLCFILKNFLKSIP